MIAAYGSVCASRLHTRSDCFTEAGRRKRRSWRLLALLRLEQRRLAERVVEVVGRRLQRERDRTNAAGRPCPHEIGRAGEADRALEDAVAGRGEAADRPPAAADAGVDRD